MIYSIYKITNKVNNKMYIGFTQNLKRRWWAHRSMNGSDTKLLYRAMKKYGRDNFSFDVLYQSLDLMHTLKVMEPSFIKEFNTFGKDGYNMNEGGDNPNTQQSRVKASVRMKTNNPMTTLRTNKGSFVKGYQPIITVERNKKISESKKGPKNPNYGKKGNASKLNVFVTCPICFKSTNKGNYARWHKHQSIA